MGLIANWALVVVTIHSYSSGPPLPTWEGLGVFPTQRACFAALERDQLANDSKGGTERYYRCNAPTEKR